MHPCAPDAGWQCGGGQVVSTNLFKVMRNQHIIVITIMRITITTIVITMSITIAISVTK